MQMIVMSGHVGILEASFVLGFVKLLITIVFTESSGPRLFTRLHL